MGEVQGHFSIYSRGNFGTSWTAVVADSRVHSTYFPKKGPDESTVCRNTLNRKREEPQMTVPSSKWFPFHPPHDTSCVALPEWATAQTTWLSAWVKNQILPWFRFNPLWVPGTVVRGECLSCRTNILLLARLSEGRSCGDFSRRRLLFSGFVPGARKAMSDVFDDFPSFKRSYRARNSVRSRSMASFTLFISSIWRNTLYSSFPLWVSTAPLSPFLLFVEACERAGLGADSLSIHRMDSICLLPSSPIAVPFCTTAVRLLLPSASWSFSSYTSSIRRRCSAAAVSRSTRASAAAASRSARAASRSSLIISRNDEKSAIDGAPLPPLALGDKRSSFLSAITEPVTTSKSR